MSDSDRNRQREHWQAIAEQLGLAPDPDEPFASEPKPPQPPVSRTQERTAELDVPPLEPVDIAEREPPPRRGRRGRSAPREKEPQAHDGSEESASEKPAAKETGPGPGRRSAEEPAPKRGRRRRPTRTSVASEKQGPDSTSGSEISLEAEASGETNERSKRLGRGRGRQKKSATAPAEEGKERQTGEKRSAADGEDTELDDVRSLSEWNVPSWNELIASLYRPER